MSTLVSDNVADETGTSQDNPAPWSAKARTLVKKADSARRSLRWKLIWAWLVYLLWQILTKLILSCVYFTLIADGAQQFIPVLGMKIYRAIPIFSFLENYEATYRLTLAHPASLLFMVFVWVAWEKALAHWLPDEVLQKYDDGDSKRAKDVMTILAVVLLIGDMCLFYLSVISVTWGATTFSASALVGTLVYAALLVFAVQQSRCLRRRCLVLATESENQS